MKLKSLIGLYLSAIFDLPCRCMVYIDVSSVSVFIRVLIDTFVNNFARSQLYDVTFVISQSETLLSGLGYTVTSSVDLRVVSRPIRVRINELHIAKGT